MSLDLNAKSRRLDPDWSQRLSNEIEQLREHVNAGDLLRWSGVCIWISRVLKISLVEIAPILCAVSTLTREGRSLKTSIRLHEMWVSNISAMFFRGQENLPVSVRLLRQSHRSITAYSDATIKPGLGLGLYICGSPPISCFCRVPDPKWSINEAELFAACWCISAVTEMFGPCHLHLWMDNVAAIAQFEHGYAMSRGSNAILIDTQRLLTERKCTVSVGWVPSAEMLADAPSRGIADFSLSL